nr:MAG TPA: hypothetical protein [Caudoviricetes sp.]
MRCFLFGRFKQRRKKPKKEQKCGQYHSLHPLIPR